MTGFITIMAFITIGFSLIFLEFNRSYASEDYPEESYPAHLYNTYKLIYADSDDSQYDFSQKLILSFILFLFNVLLLNLLISIMGDSYGSVQDKSVITDSLTRLDLILEALALIRVVNKKNTLERGYLVYCGSDLVENQGEELSEESKKFTSLMEESLGEFKGKMDFFTNKLEFFTKKTKEIGEYKQLMKICKEIASYIDNSEHKEELENLKKEIKETNAALEAQSRKAQENEKANQE